MEQLLRLEFTVRIPWLQQRLREQRATLEASHEESLQAYNAVARHQLQKYIEQLDVAPISVHLDSPFPPSERLAMIDAVLELLDGSHADTLTLNVAQYRSLVDDGELRLPPHAYDIPF